MTLPTITRGQGSVSGGEEGRGRGTTDRRDFARARVRVGDRGGKVMTEGFFSRGFFGRRRRQDTALPPGQYLEDGFPVLSAGPTPRTPQEEWDFSIVGEIDEPKRWTWEEFSQLRSEEITKDIHCVTKWSKLGTRREGLGGFCLRGGALGARARRAGAPAGAAPVLLEERQVDQGAAAYYLRHPPLLGVPGLPQ